MFRKWYTKPFSEELQAVFDWMKGIVTEQDALFVNLGRLEGFFYFTFPLTFSDNPVYQDALPAGRSKTFVVCTPGREELSSPWVSIFASPELEVWERKDRVSGLVPLRFGLEEKEKRLALGVARDTLKRFFFDGALPDRKHFRFLPSRFSLKTSLDVALWIKGRLRGSAVVEGLHLGEGIAEGVLLAARDSRFKPLNKEELDSLRIEITLIHDLRIPLTQDVIERNTIYPDKGYLLEYKNKQGWFLPEVLNVRKFSDLASFLGDLATEKARLPIEDTKRARVSIFEVEDFIESYDRTRPLTLDGPTVAHTFDKSAVEDCVRSAANWLYSMQEEDGNIAPILNPLTGRTTQIDWVRSAFCALTLAEFARATKENRYGVIAARSLEYLKGYLLRRDRFVVDVASYVLALAYLGKLALVLDKEEIVISAALIIEERINDVAFEPLLFSHIAGFFQEAGKSALTEDIRMQLREQFEKTLLASGPMNLAVWAELASIFFKKDPALSTRVSDWLAGQQLPSGAFPSSTVSNFVYTRGTGKIFEVLALQPERYKQQLRAALTWLCSMQYNEESAFFIEENIRPRVLGALRHDCTNQDAWIDSVGHLLVGWARFSRKEHTL